MVARWKGVWAAPPALALKFTQCHRSKPQCRFGSGQRDVLPQPPWHFDLSIGLRRLLYEAIPTQAEVGAQPIGLGCSTQLGFASLLEVEGSLDVS